MHICLINLNDFADLKINASTWEIGFASEVVDFRDLMDNVPVALAVFDDAVCSIPSLTATLHTVKEGTIAAGENSAAILAVSSNKGRFRCYVEGLTGTSYWLACMPTYGSPTLQCNIIHKITI